MRRARAAVVAVLVACLGVTAVGGTLWALQRRLIYYPDRTPVPAAATLGGVREVALDTSDGLRLGAWLVEPPGRRRGVAVLVAPGNAGNRADRLPLGRALAAAGLTVLLMDYRGYGGNPGSPSAGGLARDARAARDYLATRSGIASTRIIYYGESLGAAVVTELATAYPPAGMVLRSPFTDLAAVGSHHYPLLPVRALLRDRYPVAGLVDRITVPTVVVYGTADSVVPARQSREVAARCAGPTRVVAVPGADHNDPVLLDGAPVVDAVAGLADQLA